MTNNNILMINVTVTYYCSCCWLCRCFCWGRHLLLSCWKKKKSKSSIQKIVMIKKERMWMCIWTLTGIDWTEFFSPSDPSSIRPDRHWHLQGQTCTAGGRRSLRFPSSPSPFHLLLIIISANSSTIIISGSAMRFVQHFQAVGQQEEVPCLCCHWRKPKSPWVAEKCRCMQRQRLSGTWHNSSNNWMEGAAVTNNPNQDPPDLCFTTWK